MSHSVIVYDRRDKEGEDFLVGHPLLQRGKVLDLHATLTAELLQYESLLSN